MRYAFHGKVRATGQQVDGFVEAENSAEAIDKLADQGIIGVQTVRPVPQPSKPPVLLSGPPQSDQQLTGNASEIVLTQLVDKLTSLVGQVERLLTRGGVSYSGGSARGSAKAQRHPASTAQNAALKAIFETNLDLRKSLEKLANVTASLRPSGNGSESNAASPPRDLPVHPAAPVHPAPAPSRDSGSSSPSPRERTPTAVHAQPAA